MEKSNLTGVNLLSNSKLKRLRQYAVQIVLWALALLLLQTSLTAAPLVKYPLAPPDTSSPRATLSSFVENVNRSYQAHMASSRQALQEPGVFPSTSVRQQFQQGEIFFRRAERTLNLSKIPARLKQGVAIEGTLMLKEILDRIEVPPYSEVPGAEAVAAEEELSRWTIPKTEIHIVRVEEGPRAGEFLFSPETVARLSEFYQKVKTLPYKPGATEGMYQFYTTTPGPVVPFKIQLWFLNLPSWLNAVYLGETLWQWIISVISLLIAFWIPYRTFRWNGPRVAALEPPQRTWQRLLPPIIAIASLAAVLYFIDEWVNLTGDVLLIVLTILGIIIWTMVALTIFLFSNGIGENMIASPRVNPQSIDANLIRTVSRLLGLTVGTIVLIAGIERVGVSLIPIVAGLGIGGLALALAGKTTVENAIGGMILFIDRPVRVGDFCRFGEKIGTVEEIGLLSTRIRGIDRTVIAVPNADFSRKELVNFAKRDRMLLRTTIGLRYETTAEQLRFVLAKLRSMLLAHPKLTEDPARVRFVNCGDYSFDVEFFVYADTSDINEFLAIQEDVLLRVIDIVEGAGTGFAVPAQRNYLSRDSGLDGERSHAAEAEVEAWRAKSVLPFPEFPTEQREQLRDTLDFPPFGSPNARPDSDRGNNGQEN